jgi:two-component system sensor histidine kinase DesK
MNQTFWVRVAAFSVWLVFLAYPIGDLVHHRIRGPEAAVAWAGVVVFVALYELVLWRFPWSQRLPPARGLAPVLVALSALTLVLVFAFGANWIGLLIYLSVANGAVLPPRRSVVAIPAVTVVSLVASWTFHVGAANTAFFAFMTATIGGVIVAWRHTMVLVAQLREARAEVARLAVSEERLRFARDLHDLADADPQAAAREVREIETVARQSLVEVREAAAGIDPVVRVSAGPLSAGLESVLGWAVREGVTNVVVEVRDDGRGPGPSLRAGSGLPGLSERMAPAGGTLEAGPGEEGGFRLVATLPPV